MNFVKPLNELFHVMLHHPFPCLAFLEYDMTKKLCCFRIGLISFTRGSNYQDNIKAFIIPFTFQHSYNKSSNLIKKCVFFKAKLIYLNWY
jgi:hypothetical protein